ncbi:Nicotinamide n-methyltransferase nnt1 [Mycena sanguinolenta]|uniref:Nicotinamide n-methyltransferase nnt1 n=1 Tax=Mycena sanguinolenta TaxID=230812 RepID=A0A8H6Y393_9AGAR|nr:Nicotinamide n-methyltransferase nnt1 [Mycena sanguinolenta]
MQCLACRHLEHWVLPSAKANTLLAGHLFSPGLFLAERIERGLLSASGSTSRDKERSTVIELGAGCALPSLLLAILATEPATIVATDYPDPDLLENLAQNVKRNSHLVSQGCTVHYYGYEWGSDVAPLLQLTHTGRTEHGYDVVILSDLLFFRSSHRDLISSVEALLARSPEARIHIAVEKDNTKEEVCKDFLSLSEQRGFTFEEISLDEDEEWLGSFPVGGFDKEALTIRKAACRYWVGRRS